MTTKELTKAFSAINRKLRENSKACETALRNGGEFPELLVCVEVEGGVNRVVSIARLPKTLDVSDKRGVMPHGVVKALDNDIMFVGGILYTNDQYEEEFISVDHVVSVSISTSTVHVNPVLADKTTRTRKASK